MSMPRDVRLRSTEWFASRRCGRRDPGCVPQRLERHALGQLRSGSRAVSRLAVHHRPQSVEDVPTFASAAARGAELIEDVPEDSAAETWDLECRRQLFAWACERVRPTVTPSTWTAFWRLAVDGVSGETVAAETGLTTAAVYLAKSRVLARLRQAVGEVEE